MEPETYERAVRKIITDSLSAAKIIDIKFEPDVDFDGDDILKILVVFDTKSDLDASRVAGMVRRIRPAMSKGGEERFPIMSFISKSDAGEAGIEAA